MIGLWVRFPPHKLFCISVKKMPPIVRAIESEAFGGSAIEEELNSQLISKYQPLFLKIISLTIGLQR